jgi:phosphatidylglycerophosphate synthase
LDGLDGPLARHQGVASPRGSFTDTFTDQIVVTVSTLAWMIAQPSSWNISAGALYVFLYALVVSMAMARNALAVPYSWLVRPRFFVYSAMTLDAITPGYLTLATICCCNVLLALKCATGFLALRRQLPGSDNCT